MKVIDGGASFIPERGDTVLVKGASRLAVVRSVHEFPDKTLCIINYHGDPRYKVFSIELQHLRLASPDDLLTD